MSSAINTVAEYFNENEDLLFQPGFSAVSNQAIIFAPGSWFHASRRPIHRLVNYGCAG
jgi:hypothetical protein